MQINKINTGYNASFGLVEIAPRIYQKVLDEQQGVVLKRAISCLDRISRAHKVDLIIDGGSENLATYVTLIVKESQPDPKTKFISMRKIVLNDDETRSREYIKFWADLVNDAIKNLKNLKEG